MSVLHDLLRDVRLAVRTFRRTPLFATVAVVTLALGIGVTTALFAVVNAVLLEPLPYAGAERLTVLRADDHDGRPQPFLSGAETQDLRDASGLFDRVATIVAVGGSLTSTAGDLGMERVRTANVSDGLLPMLGVRPQLGRLLDARLDTTADAILGVVISDELWRRRFGSDPSIIGRRIEVNNLPVAIVGVMPRGFQLLLGPDTNIPSQIDVWLSAEVGTDRRTRSHTVLARLAPRVTVDQARAEIALLSDRLTRRYPDAYAQAPLRLRVDSLKRDMASQARPMLLALMGTVACVLLIACANVANLLFARATMRAREMAVRGAVGAGRGRLMRQLVTEGLVLGMAGGVVGVLIAQWTERVVNWLRPAALPPVDVSLDERSLLFAIALTVIASVLSSLGPAMLGTHGLADALRTGERGDRAPARRIRTALIVGEVAVSVVLLVGAGLMIRTMVALASVENGFQSSGVLTLGAEIQARAFVDVERRWQFYRSAVDRLRTLPGVQSVGAVYPLPLAGRSLAERVVAEGATEPTLAALHTTLPGYFTTMGIRRIAGRDFQDVDIDQQRAVVVVDEQFARRAWPDGRALGRRVRVLRAGRDTGLADVIGVVAHVRATTVRDEGPPQVYLPYHRLAMFDLGVVIKVAGDPLQIATAARRELESLGGNRPVYDIRPMRDYVEDDTAATRFLVVMLCGFAALALTLATVGIYGVVAYTTARRTREIGIRVALGATRADVHRLIVGDGLAWTGAGLALGLTGAALATRYLRTMLYEVAPIDPLTFAGATLLLAAVAAGACYVPSRRATRIQATQALAAE